MIIIKYKDKDHIWRNKISDDFLQFVPGALEQIYGVPVTKNEIEVYYSEGPQAKHHFDQHDLNDLWVKDGKIDMMEFKPAEYDPPELKEGDDDPDKAGEKVKAGDPRTQPKMSKPDRLEKKGELPAKKMKKWPYDKKGKWRGKVEF